MVKRSFWSNNDEHFQLLKSDDLLLCKLDMFGFVLLSRQKQDISRLEMFFFLTTFRLFQLLSFCCHHLHCSLTGEQTGKLILKRLYLWKTSLDLTNLNCWRHIFTSDKLLFYFEISFLFWLPPLTSKVLRKYEQEEITLQQEKPVHGHLIIILRWNWNIYPLIRFMDLKKIYKQIS